MKKALLFCVWFLLVGFNFSAPAKEGWYCEDGQCSPALAPTKYYGWDAWRLSDGVTEAIVVPAIGRVMSFRRVGGDEWLWSAKALNVKAPDWGGWRNWGGDKIWLSPQSEWDKLGSKKNWPPAPEWNDRPYKAEVLSGGHLRITSAVSPSSGVRIIREFWHEQDGSFLVKQTAEKLRSAPLTFGLWNITQVDGAHIDAAYLPRREGSDYENGFLWMSTPLQGVSPRFVTPHLMQIKPTTEGSFKMGTDASRAAIAITRGDWAFVESAARPDGEYPDGVDGKSGTPVQLYGQGDPKLNYLELELLSPLRKFVAGSRWTHTIRWRLEKLPSADENDPAVHATIDQLLGRA